mmetsp:Transcript_103360/g.321498  ORF Transcript_103360/g.321498 Transcript_103360/m.321498 type:complete len:344 (+) Transcript_103360:618-1649(+)
MVAGTDQEARTVRWCPRLLARSEFCSHVGGPVLHWRREAALLRHPHLPERAGLRGPDAGALHAATTGACAHRARRAGGVRRGPQEDAGRQGDRYPGRASRLPARGEALQGARGLHAPGRSPASALQAQGPGRAHRAPHEFRAGEGGAAGRRPGPKGALWPAALARARAGGRPRGARGALAGVRGETGHAAAREPRGGTGAAGHAAALPPRGRQRAQGRLGHHEVHQGPAPRARAGQRGGHDGGGLDPHGRHAGGPAALRGPGHGPAGGGLRRADLRPTGAQRLQPGLGPALHHGLPGLERPLAGRAAGGGAQARGGRGGRGGRRSGLGARGQRGHGAGPGAGG